MGSQIVYLFVLGLILQVLMVNCKPLISCGDCNSGCGSGCYDSYSCGSYCSPYGDAGYRSCAPSPPISFLPVPQPVPVRITSSKPQSVTIPNIIVALLPPNQNKVGRPTCYPRPQAPIVVPVPQPYPQPISCNSGCGSNCGC